MCATGLSRIGKTFDEAALREIINSISNGTLRNRGLQRLSTSTIFYVADVTV